MLILNIFTGKKILGFMKNTDFILWI